MTRHMNSKRPYLIRALNQWILDNEMTPQILVEAGDESARIPREYVKDGKIILNISPQAVANLLIGDEALTCHARFNGRPFEIQVPTRCVLAVFARENGKGMMLPKEEPAAELTAGSLKSAKKADLKVIK